ncbi:MAG: apolipoprotein N-acyltransferase [Candidatus Omnitrophica bacterium]|nr:apolipoprotein N-acyltransferase [Candidatus Omnitrophota bacterium]
MSGATIPVRAAAGKNINDAAAVNRSGVKDTRKMKRRDPSLLISLLVCIAAGAAGGVSFYPAGCVLLAWVCVVPLFWVLRTKRPGARFWYGFLFGCGYYLTAIYWIGKVSALGAGILCLYLALYPAVFALCARRWEARTRGVVLLPALWVLLEFVKAHLWSGFAWADLGHSQFRNTFLIQPVSIFGAPFLSFLVMMGNVCLSSLVTGKRFWKLQGTCFLCVCALSAAFSFGALTRERAHRLLPLAVVQPNVAQERKWDPAARPVIRRELFRLGQSVRSPLIVYPEAAWPYIVGPDAMKGMKEFVSRLGSAVLMGAVSEDAGKFYNTAFYFSGEGELKGKYRKMRLVPFGEYIPFRKYLGFIDVVNEIGDISPGEEPKRFGYGESDFSVLICFEDIFPGFVADAARGNDFLVNITNDAWFGGEPEASQHLSIMVMRAVENGIPIVRCANSGISGWVSDTGKITLFEKDGRRVNVDGVQEFLVQGRRKRTLFSQLRGFFVWCCAFACAAYAAAEWKARRKQR